MTGTNLDKTLDTQQTDKIRHTATQTLCLWSELAANERVRQVGLMANKRFKIQDGMMGTELKMSEAPSTAGPVYLNPTKSNEDRGTRPGY